MASTWNFQSLLSLGVSDLNSASINQKIRLTNNITVFGILLNLGYIPISFFLMPTYFPFCLTFLFIYGITLFLTYSGYHLTARYLTSIAPQLILFIFHIGTITVSESPLIGLYLIEASVLIFPWILFTTNERGHLFVLFVISSIYIPLVKPLNGLIEPDPKIDRTFMLSFSMELMFILTSFIIFGICLYLLQQITANAEKENQELVKLSLKNNEELKANEDKLNKYIEEIEAARIEDKKREWTNNGLAKFADILRAQNNEIQKSYDAIITNLVKYLDANQGGLFVVEGEENSKFIELKSYYAYERKKYLEKRIEIGEGLVGQCYLEKDIVFLTKVPENFITITSGLGNATPRCVLLVPLMLNEEVFGVIELASFKPFEQYQIDFLKKVGENTAATISNLKINERTKLLLEESQQQSEEMRSQEEEMRQNMEELSATQEEMARRQQEVEEALEEMKEKASMLDAAQEEIAQLKAQLAKV